MSDPRLKIYKGIRSDLATNPLYPDTSGWTKRLGFSLLDGLRRALAETEKDPTRLEQIVKLTHSYISYLAATNDLFVGTEEGYSAAISFRKKNNPGNKGEARIAVRTPSNQIIFVSFVGKSSQWFQGFKNPSRGFSHWWWKKHAQNWIKQLGDAPEINSAGNVKKFYEGTPRIISPGEFWSHISKTPETIIELMADAVTRAYYANRHLPRVNMPWFQKNHRKVLRKKLHAALSAALHGPLQQALQLELDQWRISAQLDSETAKLYTERHPDSYTTARYFSECNAEIYQRRTLFVQTFPFIMPILSRSAWFIHGPKPAPEHLKKLFLTYPAEWRATVDNGGKYIQQAAENLSEYTGAAIAPALVKRFAQIGPDLATDQNIILVIANLKHLADLPIHCVPTNHDEFIQLTKGVAKCTPLLDILGQDMNILVRNAGKNLVADMAKVGDQSGTVSHLKDYVEAVIGKIILAWAAKRASEEGKELDTNLVSSCSELKTGSILQQAMQTRSALRLIEASERWHKAGHQNNFVNQNQTFRQLVAGNTDWPPLTEPAKAPNGYRLVPLTSNLDLQEEGKILNHCVGGYGWQCITGNCHIISIQTKKGEHHSTLQIRDNIPQHGDVKFDKNLFSVVQHKAIRNSSPSKEAQEAASWYIEKLCGEKLKINLDAMREARTETKKAKVRILISQKIGYHPEQIDKAEELYDICREYLPINWSKPKLHEMVKALGVAEQIMDYTSHIPVTLQKRPEQAVLALGNAQPRIV